MYGTVMIGKSKATEEEILAVSREWIKARGESVGYVDEWVMRTDDGRVVVAVRFDSKQAYLTLADDPEQDRWWREKMRPILDEEPMWVDGQWFEP